MTPDERLDLAAAPLFDRFLARTHLSVPDDVVTVVEEEARALGGDDLVVRLVDYELTRLVPLAPPGSAHAVAAVEGSVQGRAFMTSNILQLPAYSPDRRRLILPLLDGTERLGTLELTVPTPGDEVPEHLVALCERLAHLVAQMIVSKGAYGDVFELARRVRPMDVSAELIRRMTPPSVFATDDLVLAALLEPCYSSGGDCYDYAVNGRTAHLAIFDAMGHGLPAAGVSSFAISAYRSARRRGLSLSDTYLEMDAAIGEQIDRRHVTAVLAELDLDTGRLSWVSAGHPPPLLLREKKFVKGLEGEPETPLGMRFAEGGVDPAVETLQPGDMVLLYTDGLPEARLPDGELFSMERLAEFIERQAAAGYPAPETLRRLRQAVLQRGQLRDDATALLIEWRRGRERALLPPTV